MNAFTPCVHTYAGINFIHNHPPPGTRLEGSKNSPPGIIIVYINPPLWTEKGVKTPLPGHKVREFHKHIYEL